MSSRRPESVGCIESVRYPIVLLVPSRLALAMLIFWLTFSTQPTIGTAQTVDPPPAAETTAATQEPEVPEKKPSALDEFIALRKSIAAAKAKTTKLILEVPNGNTDLQKQALDEIDQIKKSIAEWQQRQAELAVDAYCEAPDQHRDINDLVAQRLRVGMGKDDPVGARYDPQGVKAICEKVLASKSESPIFLMVGIEAAFACEDFDRCQELLVVIKERGIPTNPEFEQNLSVVKDVWAKEKLAREQDAANDLPRVVLATTMGNITLELFEDSAPHAVNNFVNLVETGFYTDTIFYYVRSGEVALAGAKNQNGADNCGYAIPDESKNENARPHFVGTLSCVESDFPSSQFAISFKPYADRNGKFTAYGRVIEGLELLFKIPNFSESSRRNQAEPLKILNATVIRKRSHPYEVIEKKPLPDRNKNERD